MKHTFAVSGVIDHHLKEPLISELASSLVQHNCYISRDKSTWLHVPRDISPTIEALEEYGFIECYKFNTETYIALTETGHQKGLIRVWGLSEPVPALQVRLELPLESMTSYELMTTLTNDGWSWRHVELRHLYFVVLLAVEKA